MRRFILFLVVLVGVTIPVSAQTYSNKPISWGFQKSKNHKPADAGASHEKLLKKYEAFYLGDTTKKEIYLTFDNGYENGYTADVLDVLKKRKVPATFFVTGHYLKDQPKLIKRMVREGHIVGNHSWHHPDLTQVNDKRFKEELQKVEDKYKDITGRDDMQYIRSPRGVFSERTLALSQEEGYINVFWSLAFVDWMTNAQKGWRYSYDNIMAQIHPGAILLLHTVSKDNAEALDKAIHDLQEEGYTFKSIDDLVFEREKVAPIEKKEPTDMTEQKTP